MPKRNEASQNPYGKEKGTPMFFLTADCCVLWLISRTRFAQTPGNLNANALQSA